MRFSVIVPVYNVEAFIDGAIESVIQQDYSCWELILVDDGSKDSSGRKCDDWSCKDSRIKAVHKNNGGASSARNVGISVAKGDYIVFLDGDDELIEGALTKLSQEILTAHNPELVICNFQHWVDDKIYIAVNNERYKPVDEESLLSVCEKFAKDGVQLPWRPYQCVINANFLWDSRILFNEAIAAAEDCDFFLRLIPCVSRYSVSSLPLVKYRAFRSGSLINEQKFLPVFSQLRAFCVACKEYSKNFSDAKLMRRYFADRYANIIILIERLADEQDKDICYEYVRSHKDILHLTSRKPKYLVAKLAWDICGFKVGNSFLMMLKRLEK